MRLLLASDPVVQKELRGVSRRWHTYVGRCLFVGLTAYLLYEYWKGLWHGQASREGYIPVSRFAELGRAIFTRVELVSLALTVLAAVIAGSDMIAREIRNGTLGLLLLTPITPLQIVIGKWKSAMMIAIALYLCGLPVLAVAVYLGGVGAEDLARSAAFTLGLSGVAAAFSLAASARYQSGGAAVAATLPLMLVVGALFLVADALGSALSYTLFRRSEVPHLGGAATTLTAAFLWVIAIGHALKLVRQRTGAIAGPDEHAREHRTLALDELREKRASAPRRILRTWRVVWEHNPLLWKEFTLRPALRIREDLRMRATIVLFFALLATWVLGGGEGGAILPLWGAFFVIVAVTGGSLLFAPEKEGKQWLLLLSTPVTAAQIVRAKLICGLIFPEALGLLGLYTTALLIWVFTQASNFKLAAMSAATLFLLFAYVLAAEISLRARTARGAFMVAGGILAFLLTVPSLLSAAVIPLLRDPLWQEAWAWFEALDPMTVLSAYQRDPWAYGYRYIDPTPKALECSLRYFVLYLPVTLYLPLSMVWRFRRIAIGS